MDDLSRFERFETDSGLVVYHRHHPTLWTSCRLLVGSGQRHDPREKPGTAHLLEHLLRFGNARYPRRSFEEFDGWAIAQGFLVHWGGVDAEYATYGGRTLNDAVPRLLDLVSAMTLAPDLNTDLEHEMKVIARERDEDDIARILEARKSRMHDLCGAHPLRNADEWPNDDVLFGMTYGDLRAYHANEYVRKNMTLLSCGGTDAAAIVDAVERTFGCTGEDRDPPPRGPEAFPRTPLLHERRCEKPDDDVDSVDLEYSWILPRGDTYAQRLLARTMERALFFRIREELQLSYSAESRATRYTDCTIVTVSLTAEPEDEDRYRNEVEDLLRDTDALARRFPPCLEEALLEWRLSDETVDDAFDRAEVDIITEGRPLSDQEVIDGYAATTVDDVVRLHEEHLDVDRAHLLIIEH